MKQIFIGLVAGVLLLTATISTAANLSATHTIISQTQTASGTDVMLNITVNNQGSVSLSNITLALMDPMGSGGPGSNTFTMSSLDAGTSVSAAWSISIHDPEMQPLPLMIEASGTDASGNAVHFPLLSEVQ